jgi:hypothetical protein
MSLRALVCPRCGAPLPSRALKVVIPCAFCGAALTQEGDVVRAIAFKRALAELSRDDGVRPRVQVAGFSYRVLGRIAQGESTDVFLAERAQSITERVILKVLRHDADADFVEREWHALSTLHRESPADEMKRRLPALVGRGKLVMDGAEGPLAVVMRASSGFVDTFHDVRRTYPAGVDGRHAVWMWRRTLELLAGLHQSGWTHGAVLPQHLVVHARDHGVMLVGWSCAARASGREPLPAVSTVSRECYPSALRAGSPPSPATDITMSARCIAYLLGGSASRVPPSVPRPVAALIEEHAQGIGGGDAWAIRQELSDAARQAYGPPRYHPLPMPGWRIETSEG